MSFSRQSSSSSVFSLKQFRHLTHTHTHTYDSRFSDTPEQDLGLRHMSGILQWHVTPTDEVERSLRKWRSANQESADAAASYYYSYFSALRTTISVFIKFSNITPRVHPLWVCSLVVRFPYLSWSAGLRRNLSLNSFWSFPQRL